MASITHGEMISHSLPYSKSETIRCAGSYDVASGSLRFHVQYSHRVSLSRRGKRLRLIAVYSRRDLDRSQLEFSKLRNAEEPGMSGRSVYLLSQIKNVRCAVQCRVV